MTASPPAPSLPGTPRARLTSAGELLFGAAIVICHNVFGAVPNEVPILGVLALLSLRLRSGGWHWRSLGLQRPDHWKRLLAIAVCAAVLRIALGDFVIDPLTARFWPPAIAPAMANELAGDLKTTLMYLPLIWGFAAFGEELGYRGYLLNRGAHAFGDSAMAYGLSVVIVSVLFGIGHFYKGPAGMIDSGIAGLILGGAYLLSNRSLWCCMLAHGFIDTIGLFAGYLGWNA